MAVVFQIDFWQLDAGDGARVDLDNVLRQYNAMPSDSENLIIDLPTKSVRLQWIESRGGLWFGEFVGIRTKEGAKKGDLSGSLEALSFHDDEGLAAESAFLLDPKLGILMLQRNRDAASASAVASFLSRLAPKGEYFQALPVPTDSTYRRFAGLDKVTSFEVAIAKPKKAHSFRELPLSNFELTDIAKDFEAPLLTLKMSVGRAWRRRGLDIEAVKTWVSKVIGLRDQNVEVKSVIITGLNSDEERDVIDLALERLSPRFQLNPDEGRNFLSRGVRLDLLAKEYDRHRSYLYEYFSPSEDNE